IFDMGRGLVYVVGGQQLRSARPSQRGRDALPVSPAAAVPYGIDHAPNGRIWIALFGTNGLGEFDPGNPEMFTEHVLPNADARVWGGVHLLRHEVRESAQRYFELRRLRQDVRRV